MKKLNIIFRRMHLYLGMVLIPWMIIYGFSTFMLNHGPTFRQFRPGPEAWEQVSKSEYNGDLPSSQEELRVWASGVLEENGFEGVSFGVQRNAERVRINSQRFLNPIRVTYLFADKTLIAEKREAAWAEVFLRLHFRHGYGHGSFMQALWGFIVDLVCVSFLVWVVTGLYLWWNLSHTRRWGWVAIGAGMLSFFGLLVAL